MKHKMSFQGSEFGQDTSLKDLTFSGRIFIHSTPYRLSTEN
jgi:hypothetical protein